MRVLFTTPAPIGHIHPSVPLAHAMAARGHDVLWAVPPAGVQHLATTGIRTVAVGLPGVTKPADVVGRYPELRDLPPSELPDRIFGKLFGAATAPGMLADLVPVAHEWRPDLVVADAAEFAGHIVAAELGVPSVTRAFGLLLPERRTASAADEVAPLWESRGLEPRPYGGAYDHLYLDICPPGLQPAEADRVPHRQLLQPVAYDGSTDSSGPAPLPGGSDDLPLVYLTMGTMFNGPEVLDRLIRSIEGLDARVLATLGPNGDPSLLGPYPPSVRVERYVPQTLVLPHTDVVVSHGGSGTAFATLAQGLPQLCLPQGADQFLNAAAIAGAGAGIALVPAEVTPEAVRDAVTRLLADGSFGVAARRVAESIAAMPSPDDVAAVLESLG